MIPAGQTVTRNGVDFSCPGETPCEVTIAADGTATSIGTVTAGLSVAANQTIQREAAQTAITSAQNLTNGITDTSTDEDVKAAETAIADARDAIKAATSLSEDDRKTLEDLIGGINTTFESATGRRQTAMDTIDKRETANMLYDGIKPATTGVANLRANQVRGMYKNKLDKDIEIEIGIKAPVTLTEDETKVEDLYEWKGKRYTADDGKYEAHVYSKEIIKEGAKFNADSVDFSDSYTDSTNILVQAAFHDANRAHVDLPSIKKDGGWIELNELGQRATINGSFWGVDGQYVCSPGADNVCIARWELGENLTDYESTYQFGTRNKEGSVATTNRNKWTFQPNNAEDKIQENPVHFSYGWWIHTGDDEWTASGFADQKAYYGRSGSGTAITGSVQILPAAEISSLTGKATYTGGAAGKYALYDATGDANDSGHFTARATLTADFEDGTDPGIITGKIDKFKGADGKDRNWSIELKGPTNTGDANLHNIVTGPGGTTFSPVSTMKDKATNWSIDGVKSTSDSGSWQGTLSYPKVLDDSGITEIPSIATGVFYSENQQHNGKIVGGFGADESE